MLLIEKVADRQLTAMIAKLNIDILFYESTVCILSRNYELQEITVK